VVDVQVLVVAERCTTRQEVRMADADAAV
jgi:hypothetical protein